jgi:hypothetical protein
MRISDCPAVCWLTQHSDLTYDESWELIHDQFRRSAKRYFYRGNQFDGNELHIRGLIFNALIDLQKKLLGQYLPQLHEEQKTSVTWRWGKTYDDAVLVQLPNGLIDRIDPPNTHGEVSELAFQDGCRYKVKFYRTDEWEYRETWFRKILAEAARRSNPRRLSQLVPGEPEELERPFDSGMESQVDDRLMIEKISKVMDSDEYELIVRQYSQLTPAESTARTRAYKNFLTAGSMIKMAARNEQARTCLQEMEKTPDGKRAKRLRRFERWLADPQEPPCD